MEENMDAFLEIRRIWEDEDLVELNIEASNGSFHGETQVYTTREEIKEWVEGLRGFPTSEAHEVIFSTGEKESYVYAYLRSYTFSGMGKSAMRIILESNVPTEYRKEEKNKVELELRFEPAALDRFIPSLERVSEELGAKATMTGINHNQAW